MKRIALALALLFSAGCAQNLQLPPGAVILNTPGTSTLTHPWVWTNFGIPSPELKTIVENNKTPEQISGYLQNNITWQDDYNTREFLSPNQVVEKKRTVCTGFARFWQYTLAKNGMNSHFIAVWGPNGAHAFTMFRHNGFWRLASNQYYYDKNTYGVVGQDYLQEAAVAGAIEFYGANWKVIEIYNETGQIVERKTNTNAPSVDIPGSAERIVFNIRR